MLKHSTHKRGILPTESKRQLLKIKSVKHHPPLPFLFLICFLSALHLSSGLPQSAAQHMEGLDIPESEIANFLIDLCSSIYNRMKVNENK
ncbi:hypothetical protein GDO81_005532 [Engystomops pustulosus]|uniref:Uncharacterized protein n=1 Tax=Engystomops pustulosus TaxID=76066 RepID=A0AAV7CPI3_ENGPU|nr:hypothetical protein GDO81_005532 [Engystomops pustulosus]